MGHARPADEHFHNLHLGPLNSSFTGACVCRSAGRPLAWRCWRDELSACRRRGAAVEGALASHGLGAPRGVGGRVAALLASLLRRLGGPHLRRASAHAAARCVRRAAPLRPCLRRRRAHGRHRGRVLLVARRLRLLGARGATEAQLARKKSPARGGRAGAGGAGRCGRTAGRRAGRGNADDKSGPREHPQGLSCRALAALDALERPPLPPAREHAG
eukprot:scaffold1031_cov461-Prasinococcus_capsulatus_cf.AAC.11